MFAVFLFFNLISM